MPLYSPRALRTSNDVDGEYESSPTSVRTNNLFAREVPENRKNMEPQHTTLRPPLPHVAASNNEIVPEILERDDNGQTPLHGAAESGNNELVKLLLDHGAKRELRDYKKRIPLHLAASSRDLETVIALLGPEKDMRDKDGQTPMHIAAGKGSSDIVKLLLDEKADKEAQDNSGQTPLHVAAKSGETEVVRVLIRNSVNKRAKDMNGRTPLHLALDRATALVLLEPNVSAVSFTQVRLICAHSQTPSVSV
jgi:ankyrin repeat protein